MIQRLLARIRGKPQEAAACAKGLSGNELAAICNRVAAGDMEARVIGIEPGDEFEPLGLAVNRLLDVFDSYVRESSASMEECGKGKFHRPILTRGLPGALHIAALVSNRAALKMKENTAEIARLEGARRDVVEEVNISIGAACQELSASASEILRQATDCSGLAATVVKETAQATGCVKELTGLAETINSVVKLITELAEATNMLALNAAIEASHAGVHGRGFAVVASGVKELSRDTRDATTSISARVAAIHHGVTEVTKAIDTISVSVATLDKNTASISSAVNEQVFATEEISRRVAEIVTAMEVRPSDGQAAGHADWTGAFGVHPRHSISSGQLPSLKTALTFATAGLGRRRNPAY